MIKYLAINVESNKPRRDHILAEANRVGIDLNLFNAITPETSGQVKHDYDPQRTTRCFCIDPVHSCSCYSEENGSDE